jgi:sugar O-acyltransferase (sialic acid O-acetyltransferase NeuD family)
MKELIVLGYSGHAYVVIEVAKNCGFKSKAYLDFTEATKNPFNLDYLGNENLFKHSSLSSNISFFPAVGNNLIRKKMIELMRKNQWQETIITHSSAQISESSIIGKSTLICPNVVINSLAIIGDGCIINTSAIVEHEVQIGNYTHIAPGALILGACKVGNNCQVGAGAIIKQGVVIGDDVIIGAGAVVLNNIEDNQTWIGNPAKQLLKN